MNRRGISRRSFIASSVAAAGLAGAGYWYWNSGNSQSPEQEPDESGIVPCREPLALVNGKLLDTDFPDPFAGGQLRGFIPFQFEEGSLSIGRKGGQGHNSRRIIDVASLLMPQSRVTPADNFYVRTEYPDLLNAPDEWKIKLSGHAKKPLDLSLAQLDPLIETKGSVLLECSGNHRSLRYGLMSVANWDGVGIEKVLDFAEPTKEATSVLINGFDGDSNMPDAGPPYHEHSMPTCSWVFTREQLHQAGAFLATRLNGKPLPKDQGAPVRLVVPGWFGCTEVKWVNEIKLVDNTALATLQMFEFSDRTGQNLHPDPEITDFRGRQIGPRLARDYKPASIGPSVLPVRVEQWKLGNKFSYRVVGITWGDSSQTDKLKIRFRYQGAGKAKYEPVLFCKPSTSVSSYGIWVHRFDPPKAGPYVIDARSSVQSRRMARSEQLSEHVRVLAGYFERAVAIPAV
jgi:DMSO/TMAO reductase YedYZ molybdopterin-dependent catalytic subunit